MKCLGEVASGGAEDRRRASSEVSDSANRRPQMPTENASRIHTRASDGFEGVEGIPDVENIITNKELHVRETASEPALLEQARPASQ